MAAKPKVVVTARESAISETVTAKTPDNMPDVTLVPMTAVVRLFIRTLKFYISAVLGLLGYGAVSTIAPMPVDKFTIDMTTALTMALAPTVINFLFNATVLLGKFDEQLPELMG